MENLKKILLKRRGWLHRHPKCNFHDDINLLLHFITQEFDCTRGHSRSLKRGNAEEDRETKIEFHVSLKMELLEPIQKDITIFKKESNLKTQGYFILK